MWLYPCYDSCEEERGCRTPHHQTWETYGGDLIGVSEEGIVILNGPIFAVRVQGIRLRLLAKRVRFLPSNSPSTFLCTSHTLRKPVGCQISKI